MTIQHSGIKVIDRSDNRAPSYHLQLTIWVEKRKHVQFALDQLDKHQAPWLLKQSSNNNVAVFVPGEKEMDDPND